MSHAPEEVGNYACAQPGSDLLNIIWNWSNEIVPPS